MPTLNELPPARLIRPPLDRLQRCTIALVKFSRRNELCACIALAALFVMVWPWYLVARLRRKFQR